MAWLRYVLCIAVPGVILLGCGTTTPIELPDDLVVDEFAGAYRLRKGDPLIVILGGIPVPITAEDIVNERGEVSLPYINNVQVLGMTSFELESHLRDLYVPDYFRDVSVNCIIPTERSYFLYGEIRGPGRYQFSGALTILQAIAAGGGFTEFAKPTKVELLRGETRTTHNLMDIRKHPEKDVRLEPGDIIVIPRSMM
jgi:polysaccharide export outer membrane protein